MLGVAAIEPCVKPLFALPIRKLPKAESKGLGAVAPGGSLCRGWSSHDVDAEAALRNGEAFPVTFSVF